MIVAINRLKAIQTGKAFPWILFAAYGLIFVISLRSYIVWQSVNLILGLVSLPFITTLDSSSKNSKRFGIAAILALGLAWLVPVKTMLFVSMLFAALFLIENNFGRVNILPVLACGLLSPFFQYGVSVFSFSIRIMLSAGAGKLLNLFGDSVTISGNMIASKGKEFAVDPACMGLNMMITSIFLGIVLTGILQKKYQKVLRLWQLFVVLVIITAFNIVSNLLRIILLVKFSIMPEEAMHEITGLICLFMYVCVPAIILLKWSIRKFGRNEFATFKTPNKTASYFPVNLLILLSVVLLSFKVDEKVYPYLKIPAELATLKDAKIEKVGEDIIKIERPEALIYIKPITNFYDGEHNPSICWKGSGYELKKIKDETINNMTIHTATLEKDNSTLQTAWWFDNGETQTVSQLEWRWKMFNGSKPFAVINVTASTKEELERQVSYFLREKVNREIL